MAAVAEWAVVVAPPTQLAAAHSVAAVEVFRFFAEIPTPIKSDKNQPIEPKLSDSQKTHLALLKT